jgi:hypothetical protein
MTGAFKPAPTNEHAASRENRVHTFDHPGEIPSAMSNMIEIVRYRMAAAISRSVAFDLALFLPR